MFNLFRKRKFAMVSILNKTTKEQAGFVKREIFDIGGVEYIRGFDGEYVDLKTTNHRRI